MAGAVGAAAFAWPFIDQMRPDASTLALATIEVDVSASEPGMSLTVKWRGKPVWIVRRSPEMLESLKTPSPDLIDPNSLRDQQPEYARNATRSVRPEVFVAVGICTHLGCVPIANEGDYAVVEGSAKHGGWFCPCHGSHYDTAGRIRKGPAPQNLAVPAYSYLSDSKIRIG